MKSGKRRGLTWMLSGAAFVSGIVAAGCSKNNARTTGSAETSEIPALAPVDAAPPRATFEMVTAELPTPPQINVFGEFDDVQRQPPKRIGEAGFQQHTYVDEGYDGDVAVDPKGQWLVFSSTRHSEHADIYLQRVDGISVTQLTSDDSNDANPVFSADGSRIAFCSTRAGNWDIYVMDVDGRNVVQVTSSAMQEIHPSFSPDGTRLVYCAMSSRSQQWELWTADLNTNERRMIGFGLFPSWSSNKDKDQIAFQKARARGSRWFSLWTLDLIDGDARRVTEVAVSTNAAIVCPSWSPDGRQLSFATIVEPGKGQEGQQDIWTVNADGTNRHRITDGTGVCATPFWGADNRIYFVSNRGGSDCIWSARVEQGNSATVNVDTKELKH